MRKTISIILFVITVLHLLLFAATCVTAVVDIRQFRIENPNASGSEALGFFIYPVLLIFISLSGVLFSAVNIKVAKIRWIQIISEITATLFLMIPLFAVFIIL